MRWIPLSGQWNCTHGFCIRKSLQEFSGIHQMQEGLSESVREKLNDAVTPWYAREKGSREMLPKNWWIPCLDAVGWRCRAPERWGELEDSWARYHGWIPFLPTLLPQVSLSDRLEALGIEGLVSKEAGEGSPTILPRVIMCLKVASVRKDWKVIFVGEALLRGVGSPVWRLDLTCGHVYCLSVSRVKDITRKCPDLVQPSDHYPLLIAQAGSNEVSHRSLWIIEKDFRVLGQLIKKVGAQMIFYSFPSGAVRHTERATKTEVTHGWVAGAVTGVFLTTGWFTQHLV